MMMMRREGWRVFGLQRKGRKEERKEGRTEGKAAALLLLRLSVGGGVVTQIEALSVFVHTSF